MPLTIKQENFCQAYMTEGDASKAYRIAYKTDKMKSTTINRNAKAMVDDSKIAARVNELKLKRLERTEIDADYVLKRLVEIDQMDVMDILYETGDMLPISQWPKCWRTTLSGLDIQELLHGDEHAIIKKIKWPDKVKNLELLGKHVTVQAFKEKIELEGKIDMIGPLVAARKRLEKR